jgi:hypothetical protein
VGHERVTSTCAGVVPVEGHHKGVTTGSEELANLCRWHTGHSWYRVCFDAECSSGEQILETFDDIEPLAGFQGSDTSESAAEEAVRSGAFH